MHKTNLGNRIMVIGSCGSGKTTFSIQLSKILGLPLIHLDKEYWRPGWIETPKKEWHEKVENIVSQENWIIDGNYNGSLDIRFKRTETVIFMDYNKYICLYGIFKRFILNYGRNRNDMGAGCNEKFPNLQFIRFVWNFKKDSRQNIMDKMISYEKINKVILKNRKGAKKFLLNLENDTNTLDYNFC